MGFLYLTRKEQEGVYLDVAGVRVIVTVTEVAGKRVTLGIRAPDEVRIMRCELLNKPAPAKQPEAKP